MHGAGREGGGGLGGNWMGKGKVQPPSFGGVDAGVVTRDWGRTQARAARPNLINNITLKQLTLNYITLPYRTVPYLSMSKIKYKYVNANITILDITAKGWFHPNKGEMKLAKKVNISPTVG